MIKAAIAGGVSAPAVLPVLGTGRTFAARANHRADMDPRFQDAVNAGVAYFRSRCDDQLPLVDSLRKAIASGDLESAKVAYIDARPPYEEIETIAGSFEESDADIDARPYAFEGGETDPEFRGFHKIENLIFAEGDLEAAAPYADRLMRSVQRLRVELDEPERFSPEGQFGGMVALSNEVAAKKVSSEEETWSDQSMLIFKHNWIGIYSQFKPFSKQLDDTTNGSVDNTYTSAMALVLPHFRKGSAAGTPYSQISIKERRAIADASNRLRDAIIVARDRIGITG